jgi:hypothetical protein
MPNDDLSVNGGTAPVGKRFIGNDNAELKSKREKSELK